MDATNSMYFNLALETLLTLVYKYRKKVLSNMAPYSCWEN